MLKEQGQEYRRKERSKYRYELYKGKGERGLGIKVRNKSLHVKFQLAFSTSSYKQKNGVLQCCLYPKLWYYCLHKRGH
jgi:hypothetical protein